MQYQVQEMLRAERIFEPEGIARGARRLQPADPGRQQLEGDAADRVSGRRTSGAGQLAQLKGIEDRCWVQVRGHERVFAIADEDLERENDEKTSAVHFLRFELTRADDRGAARGRRARRRHRSRALSAPVPVPCAATRAGADR